MPSLKKSERSENPDRTASGEGHLTPPTRILMRAVLGAQCGRSRRGDARGRHGMPGASGSVLRFPSRFSLGGAHIPARRA